MSEKPFICRGCGAELETASIPHNTIACWKHNAERMNKAFIRYDGKGLVVKALDIVAQLEAENTKLSQVVNDKDQELFEAQETVAELLEASEALLDALRTHTVLGRGDWLNGLEANMKQLVSKAKEK